MIAENVRQVQERINAAAGRAGRDARDITLVAVTKTHPPEAVLKVVQAGVMDVGENRVQEALQKKQELGQAAGGAQWHLIGHLQSNKAKAAVENFELIHSVDSAGLAQELNRQAEKLGKLQRVLLQLNISGEESKFGTDPHVARQFVESVMGSCPGVRVEGFMTMAPFSDNPEDARPHFSALRKLARDLRTEFGDSIGPQLSMGMTGDFEVAIEEGATLVRIGSAIFGARGNA